MAINLTDPISNGDRVIVLVCCAAGIVALTIGERYLGEGVPLAALFFMPLLVAAAFVPRWAIFLSAIAVALAREYFGPFHLDRETPARLALSLVAFTGGGLFAGELVRNRRMALELLRKTMDAESEVRALVESSPAAVLTVNSSGRITMSNDAARRVLGFRAGSPEGEAVENYIPLLARLLESKQVVNMMRTMVEASGRRRTGEAFYSQMWVSAYESASGPHLAAILSDATEQLRDREESGLRQLLSSSTIIAGAVSHEIRNLVAAASVLYHNMSNTAGVRDSPDFEALGKVIEGVLKLSSEEVPDSDEMIEGVDVASLLQELRMIISPMFEQGAAQVDWEITEGLPPARANHTGLLQVFLNLAQNSLRALDGRADGRLRITAYRLNESVVIRLSDNGPGILSPEFMFQPFQAGATSTGLGLFVSRAVIRTFGGELHHTQRTGECNFIIELPSVARQRAS
jgi:two-component system, LuxR family, sensor kinase FixL